MSRHRSQRARRTAEGRRAASRGGRRAGQGGGSARARARANIALAKYWGKADSAHNVPAVPSISLTLDRLITDTRITFDSDLRTDRVWLDGREASGSEARRVGELLDRIREAARLDTHAHVETRNRFPTAAGLASSASGFAALAAAAASAAGLRWSPARLSRLARWSSASAARSLFGGFAELPAGCSGDDDPAARALAPASHWDLRLIVAVVGAEAKAVGSTAGMERSRQTSPLYDAWVDKAPGLAREIRRGIKRRELDRLGAAMEQSTMAFHACALSASPAIVYWRPPTLAALATVRDLRDRRGISVWATMDAGPHVKALCASRDAPAVQRALARTEGVQRTLLTRPGPGVEVW